MTSSINLVEHKQCVICYEAKQITTYCTQCNLCQICELCTTKIAEMPGQPQKCPTCRRCRDWKTDKIPNHPSPSLQTQIELIIPEIIIQEATGPRPVSRRRELPNGFHYHFTCNCITINCPGSETILAYRQQWRTHQCWIRHINGNPIYYKQLIGIMILCYIIGLITTKIIQESTTITLHGPNAWIWVPLIIGCLILTSVICAINIAPYPRIFDDPY